MIWFIKILKNFSRRTASDKTLPDKAFNVSKNPKFNDYEKGFASFIYKFFDKKSPGTGIQSEIIPNQH